MQQLQSVEHENNSRGGCTPLPNSAPNDRKAREDFYPILRLCDAREHTETYCHLDLFLPSVRGDRAKD